MTSYEVKVISGEFCPDITEFVADVFYNRSNYRFPESFAAALNIMLAEDKLYAESSTIVCVYNADGQLCCTARFIHKKGDLLLPFEKEFNIDLNYFNQNQKNIVELARLASSKEGSLKALNVLIHTLYDQLADKESLIVAGFEKILYRTFKAAGFSFYSLGLEKPCLGTSVMPLGIRFSDWNRINLSATEKSYLKAYT